MTERSRAVLCGVGALFGAAFAMPGAAGAAGKAKVSVGVLGLKGDAIAPGVLTKANGAILARFKAVADFKVIKGTDAGAMMMLMGCAAPTPDCLTLIGSSMKVAKLVYGSIEAAGSGFKVTLGLFDMTTGADKSRTDTMSEAEIGAKLADLAGSLVSKSTSGVLRVSASVPGAGVMIDGGAAGSSPVTLSIKAGKHSVLVSAPGHKPYTAEVDVSVDGTVEVAAVLEPIRADGPPIIPTKKDDPPVAPIGDGRIGDPPPRPPSSGTGDSDAAVGPGTGTPKSGGGGRGVLRYPGFAAMVLGLGAGGVAAYFGVRWLGHRKDFSAAVNGLSRDGTANNNLVIPDISFMGTGDLCDPEDRASIKGEFSGVDYTAIAAACTGARKTMIFGWISAAAAAVLLGAGVGLVVAGSNSGGSEGDTASATSPSVRVLPALAPGHAGASMTVTF